MSIFGLNPEDKKQARLFYDLRDACDIGITGHPQKVMNKLSDEQGFNIIGSVPQSMFDGWDFWIEFSRHPTLPKIFREGIKWKPVNQA